MIDFIKVGDITENFGEVTKIVNNSIYFGEKRIPASKVKKEMGSVKFKFSPDPNIDWKITEQVDKYYESFMFWAGVITMGDVKKRQILEVKNNKILFEGEYYLPYYYNKTSETEKLFVEDGYIWGFCIKICNSYWKYTHKDDSGKAIEKNYTLYP